MVKSPVVLKVSSGELGGPRSSSALKKKVICELLITRSIPPEIRKTCIPATTRSDRPPNCISKVLGARVNCLGWCVSGVDKAGPSEDGLEAVAGACTFDIGGATLKSVSVTGWLVVFRLTWPAACAENW